MKRVILAVVLAVAALPAVASEKKSMSELPKAAQETIRREMPANSKMEELEEDKRGGHTYYKVEWREPDGTNYEMHVRSDGKIQKKDREWF